MKPYLIIETIFFTYLSLSMRKAYKVNEKNVIGGPKIRNTILRYQYWKWSIASFKVIVLNFLASLLLFASWLLSLNLMIILIEYQKLFCILGVPMTFSLTVFHLAWCIIQLRNILWKVYWREHALIINHLFCKELMT